MQFGKDATRREVGDHTENLTAIRHFTDREGAIEAFERHLNAPEGNRLPVLSFYGVGGVGKTLLLHKLVRKLQQEHPDIPFARLNFDDARKRDPVRALTSLWAQFEDFGVRLPSFDLPRAVIAAREGGETEPVIRSSPHLELALAIVERVVGEPISVVTEMGPALFDGLMERWPQLEETIRRWGGTSEIVEIRPLDDQQLRTELARTLALDLLRELPERKGYTCRGVVFIDTYEKLWHHGDGPTIRQGGDVDWWVRDFHKYLCNAERLLLIIAGQNRLHWPESDSDWAALAEEQLPDYLDEHLVGGLSAEDTQLYLSRCGVGKPPESGSMSRLQRAIFECSRAKQESEGALPFFVGLCANIVLRERCQQGADPPPDVFESIPSAVVAEQLARRFMRSLSDHSLVQLVRVLSFSRWFDAPLAKATAGEAVNSDTWKALTHLSFIEAISDGAFKMHSVMREALQFIQKEESPAECVEIHTRFRNCWRERLADGEPEAEREAWFHWLNVEPRSALQQWCEIADGLSHGTDSARIRELMSWWDEVEATNFVGDLAPEEGAQLLLRIALQFHKVRNCVWPMTSLLEQARRCAEAAGEKALAAQRVDIWAEAREAAGLILIQTAIILLDESWFEAAEAALTDAQNGYGKDKNPHEWARTHVHLGTAWRRRTGPNRVHYLSKAIECYQTAEPLLEQGSEDWARAHLCLGIAYWRLGVRTPATHYETARDHLGEALTVYDREHFPDEWSKVHNFLGILNRNLQSGDRRANMTKALKHHRLALEVRSEDTLPIKYAATMNNLAWVQMEYQWEDYGSHILTAIDCLKASLTVVNKKHSPSRWAIRHHNLAHAWQRLPKGNRDSNIQQAVRHAQIALSVRTRENSPRGWALTNTVLATALLRLRTGGRRNNIGRAIECLQNAKDYFSPETEPRQWAKTQRRIGTTYTALAEIGQDDAPDRGIQCCREAMATTSRRDLPYDWASSCRQLGEAYLQAGALKEALACHEAALKILTEADYPVDWGLTRDACASVHRELGWADSSVDSAMAAHRDALSVLTFESAPHFWADATCNLCLTLLQTGDCEQVEAELLPVLDSENDHAITHCLLAASYSIGNDVEMAEKHLMEAVGWDPEIILPLIDREEALGTAFASRTCREIIDRARSARD